MAQAKLNILHCPLALTSASASIKSGGDRYSIIFPSPSRFTSTTVTLKLSHSCTVKPAPFKGKLGSCFQNCYQALWKHRELSYCEGFAIDNKLPIAVSHAWLVNDNSEVIDPTWVGKKFGGSTYFGVVFNKNFVREIAEKTKHYGVLDNDFMIDHQLLQEGFPNHALHPQFHAERFTNVSD